MEIIGDNASVGQPKQPKNMEDVLRYAIEVESQNKSGTGDGEKKVKPMDSERSEFLSNALASMTSDISKELANLIEVLEQEYKEGEDTGIYEKALDGLIDLNGDIDVANDFFKLGGFNVCKTWLEKGPPGTKWRAANVIGECCQNNPFCQKNAVEGSLLKLLMKIALDESNEMVQLKSFYAISCIVRNNEQTLSTFRTLDGHNLIMSCLKSPSFNVKTKTAFLTSSLANKDSAMRSKLWDVGIVNELISVLSSSEAIDHVSCIEQSLRALQCLMTDSSKKLSDKNDVVTKLNQLQQKLSNDPAFEEAVEYIKSILEVINS